MKLALSPACSHLNSLYGVSNMPKMSDNERLGSGLHVFCFRQRGCWQEILSLEFLCDQADQSPRLMFMDEAVWNQTVNDSVDILKARRCCQRPVIDPHEGPKYCNERNRGSLLLLCLGTELVSAFPAVGFAAGTDSVVSDALPDPDPSTYLGSGPSL